MDQEPETQPVESLSLNKMGDQILSIFLQEHPQTLRRRGQVLQIKNVCWNHVSILTPGNRSRMVITGAFTQWQTSWPTSMAALAAIQARLALEW